MTKQLVVSSPLQAALLTNFLIAEIQTGFWKDMRPVGHGAAWDGVEVVVATGNEVGPAGGFVPMKNYDFLNPAFTKIYEAKLVEVARTVKPTMTFKALKKELIELARIIGGRMTDKTKEPARVYRGNNRADFDVIRTVERQRVMTVAGAKAAIATANASVKKTAVKKATTVKKPQSEEGVTIVTTSSGATVRKVAAKTAVTTES
jgi:hypothetical protein